MQSVPFLRPTVTQRMRTFAQAFQARIPPWSTVDQLRRGMYLLMVERRNDPEFWRQASAMIQDARHDSMGKVHGLPAADAEILSPSEVQQALDQLQAALSAEADPSRPGAALRFWDRCSPTQLAALAVLMGCLGLGCAKSSAVEDASVVVSPDPASAPSQVDASADSLVELFRDGSPDDVAAMLESMLDAGADGPRDGGNDASPKPAATVAKPRPRPVNVHPVPKYKGVSF